MKKKITVERRVEARALYSCTFTGSLIWRCSVLWPLICLLALSKGSAHAQGAINTYTWLARTSEVTPVAAAGWGDLWQVRDGLLQQVSLRQGILETAVLRPDSWARLRTASVELPGDQYPQLVHSLGSGDTYIWSRARDTLHVARVHQDGKNTLLFSVKSEPMIRLLTSQGAAKLFGDADTGFWVTNVYDGGTMFIEPGTWRVRQVPGLSTGRQYEPSGDLPKSAAIAAAALGREGTLWTLESASGDLVKRDASGRVLVRVASPFGKADNRRTSDVATYGTGNLAPSLAGVMVLSSTRLALASLGDDGAVLWRASVCPQGEVRGCSDEARQRGYVQTFGNVAGDAQGNAYVGDGVRVFRIGGADSSTLLLGSVPPCVPSRSIGLVLNKPAVACVNKDDRLVTWGPGNHAIYTITGGLAATYKLVIEPSPPASVRFQPMTAELADQPLALRKAILASVLDLRVWQPRVEEHQNGQTAMPSHLGIPTSRGVVFSKEMMRKELSDPDGGALRTPEDVYLSDLFGSHKFGWPGGYSAGRLGVDSVVIKDWRVGLTRLANYDAQAKKLTQDIVVKGLPERVHQTLAESQTEYVFNDQDDRLYLFQGWSGEVYSINKQFSAKRVASLPAPSSLSTQQFAWGAMGSAQGPVRSAVKTPSGRLVLATPAGVFVQIGDQFAPVSAPEAVLQLVAVNEVEVLALAKGGLAKLSLPR